MSNRPYTKEEHDEIEKRTEAFFAKFFENYDLSDKTPYEIYQIDEELLAILNQGEVFTEARKYIRSDSSHLNNTSSISYHSSGMADVGMTLLMCASRNGYFKTTKKLLEMNADIEAINDGKTVIFYPVTFGHKNIVSLFIANNANIHAISMSDNESTLMCAARKGETEIIELLLDNNLDIEARDKDGKTALIYAIESNQLEAVKLLISRGADIEARDNQGKTALMYAAENNRFDIMHELIKQGADIEARDYLGKTATMYDRTGTIIELGGNANVEDYEGNKIRHNREALDKGREFYNNFAAGDKILSNRVQIYQALAFTPLVSDSRQKVHYIDNLTKIILSKKWKNYAEITEDFIKGILESMRDNDGTVTDPIIENIIWNFRKQKQFEKENSRPQVSDRER